MAFQSTPAFSRLWQLDDAREALLGSLPRDDLLNFRLACRDFAQRAAPHLFEGISVCFRSSTFTKPARMDALSRIGLHIKTLSFFMAHGPDTFLPPLLDPMTGEELEFVYEPYCQVNKSATDRPSIPTYGSWEMTDVLVKQYPPLFHAAANVPSFFRALNAMPNLGHLEVSCPGQEPEHRYRRDIVDYALISLRIAVERAGLAKLDKLSLRPVHPASVLYLNPLMGPGALPNSARRWRQIKELAVHMDTIPYGPKQSTDHLKLLHSYLQTFSASLERLTFHWNGSKGLFPLALGAEQCLITNSPGLACPRRCHLALRPLKFSKLVFMEVENVTTDASQVSGFILAHRRSISEFNFESTTLRRGTWDDALAPLTRISGSDKWKEQAAEVMEVPLILSPVGLDEKQKERVAREALTTSRCPTPLLGSLQRATTRGKGLFGLPGEHMRKFLRSSVSAWRQF
ncbi:MAG: hypothetical protein MMC23_006164 [Stictis urceolatum]|nr:hypothetical protein [Stictis urceolata]